VTSAVVSDDPLSGESGVGGSARKAAIRKVILARRDATDPAWRAEASGAIAENIAKLRLGWPAGPIAAYWPYKSEADPRPALERIAARDGRVMALPVIAHPQMRFLAYSPHQPLVEAGFGTMGPPHDALEVRPAILLVPLAAFDAERNRIGWGKGHYDRAIERLVADGAPLLTIGIAFSFQQVPAAPAEAHDRPLDAIVTEAGAFVRS
jgi:5-formyltetrahydrofolate cyclo-ligase